MSVHDMDHVWDWCRKLDEAAERTRVLPLPEDVAERIETARAAHRLGEELRRGKPMGFRR